MAMPPCILSFLLNNKKSLLLPKKGRKLRGTTLRLHLLKKCNFIVHNGSKPGTSFRDASSRVNSAHPTIETLPVFGISSLKGGFKLTTLYQRFLSYTITIAFYYNQLPHKLQA
jgi:hypothetical protein